MNYLLIILSLLFLNQCDKFKKEESTLIKEFYQSRDSLLITEKLNDTMLIYNKTTKQDIFTAIAKSFLDTPYSSNTLDISDEEKLIINAAELDCQTFIETTLAITNTIASDDKSFKNFKKQLAFLRYRNGIINNYASRIHYFSEWIFENDKNGVVENLTRKLGGIKYPSKVNFMSTHPSSYKQLKINPELITEISNIEKKISNYNQFYIPKEKVVEIEETLETGMIIGITTNIPGLDIIHTGILVKINNQIRLLHASSDEKKVVISELTLYEYLMSNKKQTGIIILNIK